MNKLLSAIIFLFILLFSGQLLIAQNGIFECYQSKLESLKIQSLLQKRMTGVDANIDIKYYKLDLNIDPENNNLSGIVTLKARVSNDSLNEFYLDLQSNMSVQNITSDNSNLVFNHSNNILTIHLQKYYTTGTIFSVDIYYSGTPSLKDYWGMPFRLEVYNGHKVAFTQSQPFWASFWFPCKDDPSDKADSARVWVTAKTYYKVASNGLLEGELENGNGTRTTKWFTRYPISNYLLCVTMSDYVVYENTFSYGNNNSMPVIHYVWPEDLEKEKKNLNFTIDLLNFFSEEFGLYPFINEKYGHAQANGGGMEHQTMTTMPVYFSISTMAHELAHHWFGDMITFKDYHHVWLSEGFATYCDLLQEEHFIGKKKFNEDLNFYANSPNQPEYAAKNAVGSLYLKDIDFNSAIFNPGNIYRKGAWVLHMLRGIVGDEIFFSILKNYANKSELRYKIAETADFQKIAEEIYGQDLDYFFNEWVYGEHYPKYSVGWNYKLVSGNTYEVTFRLKQDSNTNPLFFTMPVQIKVTTTNGIVLKNFYNERQEQDWVFTVEGLPTSLTFDPDNWILKDITGPTSVNDTPGVPTTFSLSQNYPNPFNPSTMITWQLPVSSYATLKVFDELGNEIASLVDGFQQAGIHNSKFATQNYSLGSGIYFYTLKAGDFSETKKMMILK